MAHRLPATLTEQRRTDTAPPAPRRPRERHRPRAEPSAARRISLDEVPARWRAAFDRAADALSAAETPALRFPGADLNRLRRQLTEQRAEIGRLLDGLAREEHVVLARPLSAPRATRRTLGLPEGVLACIFDLDGALTGVARVHAAAWAETFDGFLLRQAERIGERYGPFRPFDPELEYTRHLHGRPRIEGVHAFLASRGIRLPEGRPDDPPGTETVHGLSNAKNLAFQRRIEREGVAAYADSRLYLEVAREAGLVCAVVSASANTDEIVERAGLAGLVDATVVSSRRRRPRPAADTVLAACSALGVAPARAVLFETTLVGVDAGLAAGVARVVIVERHGQDAAFLARGADQVVPGLAALLEPAFRSAAVPGPQRRAHAPVS